MMTKIPGNLRIMENMKYDMMEKQQMMRMMQNMAGNNMITGMPTWVKQVINRRIK